MKLFDLDNDGQVSLAEYTKALGLDPPNHTT